jgi:hypothetical protein
MEKFPFIAFFKGKKLELYATSLWDAKQQAIAVFKPSKKDAGLVAIERANTAEPCNTQFN